MSGVNLLPTVQNGTMSIADQIVQINSIKVDGKPQHQLFIEWITAESGEHNLTLVCCNGTTTKAEIQTLLREVEDRGRVDVRTLAEVESFDPDNEVLWIKHHPTPHPKAANPFDLPWGSPFTFAKPAAE